jgi:hypothetical protein
MKTKQERENILLDNSRVFGAKITKFMLEERFCTCPASTKYHGNYDGGLFDHSLAFAEALVDMTQKLQLKWENELSPIRIAFFHDLCKLDNYKKVYDVFYSNSDADTFHYEYNESTLLGGHGEKSVIIALQHEARLTEEEIMCIRYHMGAYVKEDWDYFDKAIKKYPNVLYTHTADMIASKIVGI